LNIKTGNKRISGGCEFKFFTNEMFFYKKSLDY